MCYLVDTVNQEGTIAAVISGVQIAQPDVTLMLDSAGIIQGATLSNDVSDEVVDSWRGRLWGDTVGDNGIGKVQRMVEDANRSGVSAFRQINQVFPSGRELPMEYTTVRLGGTAGLIAVGRNLKVVAELQSRLVAAQQAMEQDYWKLREVETRYRLLFDASNEAVLLLNAESLQIVEANPAAIRALGVSRGRAFLPEIASDERDAFQNIFMRVRQYGRAPATLVHLGADREAWTARASLMAGEPGPVVLVQLAPVSSQRISLHGAGFHGEGAARNSDTSLDDFFDRLPDAFVVTDRDGQPGLSRSRACAWRGVGVGRTAGALDVASGRRSLGAFGKSPPPWSRPPLLNRAAGRFWPRDGGGNLRGRTSARASNADRSFDTRRRATARAKRGKRQLAIGAGRNHRANGSYISAKFGSRRC